MVATQRATRVLVVDDDADCASLYADSLRHYGFDVITATRYYDALDIIERRDQRLDLMITDLNLDRGNGFALARTCRMWHPHLQTIHVTGDVRVDVSEAVGPILRKPIDIGDLLLTVRRVLRR